MAYIDKDKVIQLLRTDVAKYYPTTFLNGILASAREIAIMSAEDVVPRSEVEQAKQEVAREIFEEIEKKLTEDDNIFKECASGLVSSDYCSGRSDAIIFILNLIAKLKKERIGE